MNLVATVAAAAGLALVAAVTVQTVRLGAAQKTVLRMEAARAAEVAAAERAKSAAITSVREAEQAISKTIAGALTDERKKSEALADDLRGTAAARDRLRDEARRLAASCGRPRPASPAAAASGPAADAPGDLLADMLVRMDAHGRELAEYADRVRIAGETCVASYEALTTQAVTP